MTPEEKLKAIAKIILTALDTRQNDTMRLLRQIQTEINDFDFATTLVWAMGGPEEEKEPEAPPPTRLQSAIERNRLKMATKQ